MIANDILHLFNSVVLSCSLIALYVYLTKYYTNNKYPLKISSLSTVERLLNIILLIIPWLYPIYKIIFPVTAILEDYFKRLLIVSPLLPISAILTDIIMLIFTFIYRSVHKGNRN